MQIESLCSRVFLELYQFLQFLKLSFLHFERVDLAQIYQNGGI